MGSCTNIELAVDANEVFSTFISNKILSLNYGPLLISFITHYIDLNIENVSLKKKNNGEGILILSLIFLYRCLLLSKYRVFKTQSCFEFSRFFSERFDISYNMK